jgi:hypothetical protein
MAAHVARVEVHPNYLRVELQQPSDAGSDKRDNARILTIPWQKPPAQRRREILLPESSSPEDNRPVRADARARLIAAIARVRRWLDQLVTGTTDIAALACRERCSLRKVNMTLTLAFLAPDLVKAAIEGRLPRGIGIARLCDLPAEWPSQFRKLGIAIPALHKNSS